jgi:hypothetical protein
VRRIHTIIKGKPVASVDEQRMHRHFAEESNQLIPKKILLKIKNYLLILLKSIIKKYLVDR